MGTKRIKVLEAIRQGKIGGGETHVLELVSKMEKTVFEPVVLSFTQGPMVQQLQSLGIEVYVIETERSFDRKIWKKVRDFIRKNEFDIVHAHGTRANSNVFWAAKSLKLPLVYTVHGWSFHQDQPVLVKKMRELSEMFLTSVSTSTICVSNSNQNDGIRGWKMKRSVVIYNGINTEKFNPGLEYKSVRKEFDIADDKTLIGFIVRMTIQKDPFILIKAMRIVMQKTNDVVLLMVGDGDLKQEAVQMVNELNLSSNIIFEDFRQDVPDVLKAIDIYCLPSLWEGLPIGVLEAMSMSKVVIATPVDGTKEIMTDMENGILVPVRDEQKLAEAILRVHYDKPLQIRLSENAVRTIHQKFSIEEMVKKIENHYLTIMNLKR
ncbi:MAG: glycosyltransferase family 4 protein [Bacteroidota bacterium]